MRWQKLTIQQSRFILQGVENKENANLGPNAWMNFMNEHFSRSTNTTARYGTIGPNRTYQL